MKTHYLVFGFLLSITLIGCASVKVESSYDNSYNYTNSKTYTWHPGIKIDLGDARVYDDKAEKRLKKALEAELRDKGILRVNAGAEDMILAFHVALNEPIQRDVIYESWVEEYGNFTILHIERGAYEYSIFDEGTIILDVILPQTNDIIWRGAVQAGIQLDYKTMEQREKQLKRVVRKLLKDFPPK